MRGQGVISCVVHPSPNPFLQGKGALRVIPETDHAVAAGFDDAGAIRVSWADSVLPAVQSDGEEQRSVGEISIEVAYGKLAREFRTFEPARSHVQPEALFRNGHIVSNGARATGQSLFRQCGTLIPNLFPQGQGLQIAKLS